MMRKLREARDEEGFTLIELLVVVLIIGILAAIAIPVFLNQREKAYRDAAASDVRNLALVMEDHASDNLGVYSSDLGAMGFNPSEGVTVQAFLVDDDADGTVDGYCLQSWHTAFALGETWSYEAHGGNTVVQVDHDNTGAYACAGTAGTSVLGS